MAYRIRQAGEGQDQDREFGVYEEEFWRLLVATRRLAWRGVTAPGRGHCVGSVGFCLFQNIMALRSKREFSRVFLTFLYTKLKPRKNQLNMRISGSCQDKPQGLISDPVCIIGPLAS